MTDTRIYACRFCRHDIDKHNGVEGCPFCRCMATTGEGSPRTDAELDAGVLHPSKYLERFSPSMSMQARIDMMRERADKAERDLLMTVDDCCEGPHVPIQHRDRQPPWCRVCGRDNRGIYRRETPRID